MTLDEKIEQVLIKFRTDTDRRTDWDRIGKEAITAIKKAFERGDKDTEYRIYGPRWNEKTCRIGRRVVLSKGYGKKNRMTGVILGFDVSEVVCYRPEWKSIYGNKKPAACIMIGLDKDY